MYNIIPKPHSWIQTVLLMIFYWGLPAFIMTTQTYANPDSYCTSYFFSNKFATTAMTWSIKLSEDMSLVWTLVFFILVIVFSCNLDNVKKGNKDQQDYNIKVQS